MVARIWKGAVRREDGDEYAQYIEETGVAEYKDTPGNRAVYMLRRDVDDRCEFQIVTLWDSLDAVKAFAGEDYERSVYYPEDERYLVEKDELTSHWQVAVSSD